MEEEPKPLTLTACGGTLLEPEKYPSADYNGRRIYFCNLDCLHAFEKNPDGFMKGEVPHPLGIS
jgi:YHS domain-containing protein